MFNIGRLAAVVIALNSVSALSVNVLAEETPKAIVVIQSYQFEPNKIKVKKGSAVLFINKDGAPHTVSPSNKIDFTTTGRILGGEQKPVTFEHVGTIKYFCDFHPSMEGTVVVTEN
jgi:plastocyanin